MTGRTTHFFSKFINIILRTVIILVFFILANVISMLTLSYLSAENYRSNESPSPFFMVVLEVFEEYLDQKTFVCVRWDDFKELPYEDKGIYAGNIYVWKNYETRISETNNSCQNMSSEFEVENIGPGVQRVRLKWQKEASKVEDRYSVVDNKIVPLYYREFMSSDIAVFGFLISLVLTPVLVLTFRFVRKR